MATSSKTELLIWNIDVKLNVDFEIQVQNKENRNSKESDPTRYIVQAKYANLIQTHEENKYRRQKSSRK